MKLLILVETPNDDNLHGPRIHCALHDYIHRARQGDSDIGRTGGPNRMVASNGVKVLEARIDLPFLFGKYLPTFRRAWRRLSAWWLHSRLNPWSIVDLDEPVECDGQLIFRSKRRYRRET